MTNIGPDNRLATQWPDWRVVFGYFVMATVVLAVFTIACMCLVRIGYRHGLAEGARLNCESRGGEYLSGKCVRKGSELR